MIISKKIKIHHSYMCVTDISRLTMECEKESGCSNKIRIGNEDWD